MKNELVGNHVGTFDDNLEFSVIFQNGDYTDETIEYLNCALRNRSSAKYSTI